ncbi:MAG: hypothetical protein QOI54_2772 [Actinomycetota bacterium]|jgi:hypothetical protein|nr:hypothetical protein [Actinomycetota bacterium]
MALEERLRDMLSQDDTEAWTIDPRQVMRRARRQRRARVLLGATAVALSLAAASFVGLNGWTDGAHTSSALTAPSATAESPSADSTAAVVVEYEKDLGKWVACLQARGIELTTPVEQTDALIAELGRYKDDPAYATATRGCSTLLPEVTPALERAWGQDPTTLLSVEQLQAERDYADCMHRNGAAAFPEPGSNGFTEQQWLSWNIAVEASPSQAALKVCGPLSLPAPR